VNSRLRIFVPLGAVPAAVDAIGGAARVRPWGVSGWSEIVIASVPVLTFVSYRGAFVYECQNQKDTSKRWILVWFWI